MISRHTRPFSITPTERDLADEVSRPANIEVIRGYCHSQIWQTDCDARIMAPTRIDPERIASRIRSARRRLHWLSQRMQADRAAMEEQRDSTELGQRTPCPTRRKRRLQSGLTDFGPVRDPGPIALHGQRHWIATPSRQSPVPSSQSPGPEPPSPDPDPESRVPNPESRIPIPNPESRVSNPESRSRVPNIDVPVRLNSAPATKPGDPQDGVHVTSNQLLMSRAISPLVEIPPGMGAGERQRRGQPPVADRVAGRGAGPAARHAGARPRLRAGGCRRSSCAASSACRSGPPTCGSAPRRTSSGSGMPASTMACSRSTPTPGRCRSPRSSSTRSCRSTPSSTTGPTTCT